MAKYRIQHMVFVSRQLCRHVGKLHFLRNNYILRIILRDYSTCILLRMTWVILITLQMYKICMPCSA